MTFVSENCYPEYPEHCDIINTWCYSNKTPYCPKKLFTHLEYAKDEFYIWSRLP